MAEHRAVVRGLYRELLKRIDRLPAGERATKRAEAVREMHANMHVLEDAKRADLLKQLVSRVSWLRVITPNRPGDGNLTGSTFVVRDGKVVEGGGDSFGVRVASSQCDMNEFRVKHEQLMRRQHYGNAPPAYDPRSF